MDLVSGKLLVVSDVHLRFMDDQRSLLLIDMLSRIDFDECEYLVLNGDIFDFCFGPSKFYQTKFERLGTALAEVASRGVRVLFMEGNHEFRIREIGWPKIGFVDEGDYVLTLSDGARVKIAHGDLIKHDFWYRLYRGLVKSRLAGLFARYLPQRLFDKFCLRYASHSRSLDDYRELDRKQLYDELKNWLSDGSFDYGVVGHFHVPFAEPSRSGMLVSVDSWDKPNVLSLSKEGARRIWLTAPGEKLRIEPAKSALTTHLS